MRTQQKGFTLIELMIVIAIISILLAAAIPIYQDYTTRTKVAEGLTLSSAAKLAVIETYSSTGSFASNNAAYGLPNEISINGTYTSTVSANTDTITITYKSSGMGGSPTADGTTVILEATALNYALKWTCTGTTPTKYRPNNCR